MKIIFYLPVNTDKPNIVAYLVFVGTERLLHLSLKFRLPKMPRSETPAPVAKQWIAEDIPSYGSQSKRAKSAIHWFGKY